VKKKESVSRGLRHFSGSFKCSILKRIFYKRDIRALSIYGFENVDKQKYVYYYLLKIYFFQEEVEIV